MISTRIGITSSFSAICLAKPPSKTTVSKIVRKTVPASRSPPAGFDGAASVWSWRANSVATLAGMIPRGPTKLMNSFSPRVNC